MGLKVIARAATFAAGILITAQGAKAQGLPPGDVHFICGYAAGTGADVIVRWGEYVKVAKIEPQG